MRRLALACIGLALAMLVATGVAHVGRRANASGDQPALEGLLRERVDVERTAIGEGALAQLDASALGLVVTSGPQRTAAELAQIVASADRGARVLVLGDVEAARVFGVSILPASIREPDPTNALPFPDAHPVVDGRNGARVLARSSNTSFVDTDGDARASAGDAPGPFGTLVATPQGRVLVAGSMTWGAIDEDGKRILADVFPPGTRVLIESRATLADAPLQAFVDMGASPVLGVALGGLLVGGGALAVVRRRA